jgi:hypothetical protein
MGVDPNQLGTAGPPIGELLLARGLITAEELEQALAHQRESGRPLGETLVRLGFTTGPMVAQALATQHGRMLKSEYGFATGFDAMSSPSQSNVPADEGRPSLEQPARQIMKIIDADPRATAAEVEIAPSREDDSELRERLVRSDEALRDALRERDEAQAQLRAELAASETLRRKLAAELHQRGQVETAAAAQLERLAQAEADARLLAEELESARAERDITAERATDPEEVSDHLVFFPAPGRGYLLVERAGPPPAVGAVLDLSADGGSAVSSVLKVARLSLAGRRLPCAYLA